MVKIRLRRVGAKKQPHYRVVVTDSRSPRDGKFLETIGHYNPRTEPPTMEIDADRALYWLSVGAQPSEAVKRMLDKLGISAKAEAIKRGEAPPEIEPEGEAVEAKVEAVEAEEEAVAVESEAEEEAEAETAMAEMEAEEDEAEEEEAEEGEEEEEEFSEDEEEDLEDLLDSDDELDDEEDDWEEEILVDEDSEDFEDDWELDVDEDDVGEGQPLDKDDE